MTSGPIPTSQRIWWRDMAQSLTTTQLLAAATELLTGNGYSRVDVSTETVVSSAASRTFEDAYGIVALHIFETWTQLTERWNLAQGALVDVISEHLSRPEPKAWEGYLVLITPGLLPLTDRIVIDRIRADTNRVRKLVATGEDLTTIDGVRGTLLPLLPLMIEDSMAASSGLLNTLPDLLSESGIPRDVSEVVVRAFVTNESVLEQLHSSRSAP